MGGVHHDVEAPFPLTGWKKHFNTYTLYGRRNMVAGTLGSVTLIGLYFKLRTKKVKSVEE